MCFVVAQIISSSPHDHKKAQRANSLLPVKFVRLSFSSTNSNLLRGRDKREIGESAAAL